MSFNVQEIAQLLKQAKENKKPYVFFTGAGCSMSADIPSATGLIKEIQETFPIQIKNIDEEKDKYNYGKYMSALDKDERRRLLKPHIIDNKNINWAHIALACLIQAEYIQRVLTFNFDSILSRACNMLGLHPSIYDFATANPHLYHLINDPSIVHLHGQGTGFIQLNTEDETKNHTEKLSDFIAATLNSNPSLFIGYSGNADEFFPLLKEKYSEQHRLIWAGTKSSIEEIEAESVKAFLKDNQNITHYIGNIDADDFLVQLAKELDCFPPELFSNPYNFLNNQLKIIQPYPLGDGLDILENLSTYLNEQAQKPLSKNLYTAVIHKYPNKVSTNELSEKAINDIMWAYDQQADNLRIQKKFTECFKIYDQALSIYDRHYGCLHNYAVTLTEYAYSHKDLDKFKRADKQFTKLIKIQPKNFNSIFSYANMFLQQAYISNDEYLYNQAIEHYNTALSIQSNHYQCNYNYAIALNQIASIKQDSNMYASAILAFETALNYQPNDKQAINLYCWALIKSIKLDPILNNAEKVINALEMTLKEETDNCQLLETFSSALLIFSKVFNDQSYLLHSEKILKRLLIVSPEKTYNYACYYSLIFDYKNCEEKILNAELHGTLPENSYKHLNEDEDLDNVRNEPWFIELLERLKVKEETEK